MRPDEVPQPVGDLFSVSLRLKSLVRQDDGPVVAAVPDDAPHRLVDGPASAPQAGAIAPRVPCKTPARLHTCLRIMLEMQATGCKR